MIFQARGLTYHVIETLVSFEKGTAPLKAAGKRVNSGNARLLIVMIHARDNIFVKYMNVHGKHGGYLCTSLPSLDKYMFSSSSFIHHHSSIVFSYKSISYLFNLVIRSANQKLQLTYTRFDSSSEV